MRTPGPLPSSRNPPRPLPSSNSFPRHAADDRQHLRTRACARQSPYLRHKAAPRPFRRSKRSLLPFSPRTRTIPARCPFSPCMRRTPSVSEKVRVKNCSRTPADVAVISPAARHPGLRSRRAFGTAIRRTKSDAGFRALGAPTHVQTRQTPRPSFPKSPGKSPRRLTAGPLPRAACSLFQTIKIRAIAS